MFALALFGTAMAGTPARWPDSAFPITYSVQADLGAAGLDDAAALDEIDQAFTEWKTVDCFGRGFQRAEERVKDAAFGDDADQRNTVFVVVKDLPEKLQGQRTAVNLVVDDDNMIQEGDIGLNAVEYSFALDSDGHKALDLQSALTHEIGHFLGLEDNLDDDEATMNPGMIGRPAGRSLAKSDQEALCDLYPEPTDNKDTGAPPHSAQGDSCTRAEDCTDGFVCVVDNGDQYCATRCGADGACPSKTSCEDPGSGSPVCILERETGCAVAPRTNAGFLGLVLAALALRGRTRQ